MLKKIFALIMACLMGLVVLCGCENADNGGLTEKNAPDMIELNTWHFTSGVPNNEIKVNSENENAVFTCTTQQGTFWDVANRTYNKQVTLSSNESAYWHSKQIENNSEPIYVDVVAREENHIVGYAVIKIIYNNDVDYTATVLKSVTLPMKNGDFQAATEQQIESLIEQAK